MRAARPERDSGRRADLILTALGFLGLVLFLAFYDRAFPSAALDLKLSRSQVRAGAAEYIAGQGIDLSGYRTAITFDEAWLASIYLQRTVGIPQTNDLARREGLPLWYWEVRWFKPAQKEELTLSLTPGGTVVGMSHLLLEDAPGADLPQEEAQALAVSYLTADRGWDLDGWELVTASTQAQPGGRADHHFEWKRSGWAVGESELRLAIDVQGDRVDGYGYWLKVPEAFERHFWEQYGRAGFFSNLSFYLGAIGFSLVALIFYALGHRRGVFPWDEGVRPGLIVGAVSLLAALNSLVLRKAVYPTTQDYLLFWIASVVNAAIEAAVTGGTVMILWGGGRYLARKVWPGQDKLLPRSRDRRVPLGRSVWRGLMAGSIASGYVVLFYLAATRLFGGWTPMDVTDVNLYATPLPFLAPLEIGVVPAITEEFVARLVGIGALPALTRRRWFAVLVPGVLWAFAHLFYLRDPIWLRGVELTAMALFYGWLFLRFDLTTTIVAHLSYNAGLSTLPLLRSGQPYFVLNGALVVAGLLAPTIPAAVWWLRRRLRGGAEEAEPSIRPASEQDPQQLSDFVDKHMEWHEIISNKSNSVLCLCLGDQVIGAAAGSVGPQAVGEMVALYVEPGWRRQYWGRRLAQALSDELRARGAQTLQVSVPVRRWALARFWDSLGWSPAMALYTQDAGSQAGAGVPSLGEALKRVRRSPGGRRPEQP